MLTKTIERCDELLRVPMIEEPLYVDRAGRLYNWDSDGLRPFGDSITTLVTVAGVVYHTTVYNLIQVTWKPVYADDYIYYLTKRKVVPVDGSLTNRRPDNLIWAFEESMVDGMYRIPGISRYLLTDDGQVYNRSNGKYQNFSYGTAGDTYPTVCVRRDYMSKVNNAGVHRLIALARIPYAANVDSLDVNHKDGDKTNYAQDNLEWSTRTENNIHANQTGLKRDSNQVHVTNMVTGETISYHSQAEAARRHDIQPQTLSKQLLNGSGTAVNGDYKFVVTDYSEAKGNSHIPVVFLVLDKQTGDISTYSGIRATAEAIGVNPVAFKGRFRRNRCEYERYHVKWYRPSLDEAIPTF